MGGRMQNSRIIDAHNNKRKWASFISNVTIPPLIAVLMFGLINYSLLRGFPFVAVTCITTLFAAIVPLSTLLIWETRANAKFDLDIPTRTERNHPLLFACASYLVAAVVLLAGHAPLLTTVVMFGYFVGTLFLFFINLYWKISIHTMGIAGPTTVLVFVFGYWGALLGLLLPPVIWSRVYLKKHTVAQAIMGAILGFCADRYCSQLRAPFSTHKCIGLRPQSRKLWSETPYSNGSACNEAVHRRAVSLVVLVHEKVNLQAETKRAKRTASRKRVRQVHFARSARKK
jgi:membrane-associated phospholipid phosphatase